ncbi:MAG TPA: ferritin-like domain-containing protein [Acetobacteraceae bacterium]|nr:ferritin-like domain-containing protein [Acetobacteraceae bacterium]
MERRSLIQRIGLGAAGVSALSALGTAGLSVSSKPASAQAVSDADIFNFALNLEYLEAEFYVRAVTGSGIPPELTGGTGTQGTVTGGAAVPFKDPVIAGYARRIADDELGHVRFIRMVLGDAAVAEPAIDLQASFTWLAIAAGLVPPGVMFDPFADDLSFLLGAYIFEDVGVTAYAGAANLLSAPASVRSAARILGVEGYHAGAIRAALSVRKQGAATDAISALRAQLSGVQDFGTDAQGNPYNITDVNSVGLAFTRTAGQVLAIVYGGGTNSGLFFPEGVNGTITTATQPSSIDNQEPS